MNENDQPTHGGGAFNYPGMTLRDYFAAMAMQGILAGNFKTPPDVTVDNVDDVIAREAYRTADAMIKYRQP